MRKLEHLAADALAQGCDTLVSIGGVQSNHTRQVAAVAARSASAACSCRSTGSSGRTRSTTRWAISCLADHGRDVRLDPAGFDIGIRPSWEEALASVEARGGKPYAIPAAPGSPARRPRLRPLGRGSCEQEGELGVFFDTIVVCSVTGSTQAGMIAGFAVQERPRAVLGIDGSATVEQTWAQIARIARNTAEAIGLGRELRDDEIVLLDEWHAGTVRHS